MNGDSLSSGTEVSSSPTILVKTQLLNSFQDHEYRHAFLEEHVRAFIALQVRALREERKLTQAQLGELMGKAQAWISRLEDPDYGKVTIATLLDLAEAFDTALVIRFAAFSDLLDRLVALRPGDYSVVSFGEDNFVQQAPLVRAAAGTNRNRPDQPTAVRATGTNKVLPFADAGSQRQSSMHGGTLWI